MVAWTSGRCDASACGRVSGVSESMESSEAEKRDGTKKGSAPKREEGRASLDFQNEQLTD